MEENRTCIEASSGTGWVIRSQVSASTPVARPPFFPRMALVSRRAALETDGNGTTSLSAPLCVKTTGIQGYGAKAACCSQQYRVSTEPMPRAYMMQSFLLWDVSCGSVHGAATSATASNAAAIASRTGSAGLQVTQLK